MRTLATARERCDFTVPCCRPVACAISFNSISSTYRSKKSVRGRSLMRLTTVHTRVICSRVAICCSGDLSVLGSHSLASIGSTPFVRACRQNYGHKSQDGLLSVLGERRRSIGKAGARLRCTSADSRRASGTHDCRDRSIHFIYLSSVCRRSR
jgi:hypothetical protein